LRLLFCHRLFAGQKNYPGIREQLAERFHWSSIDGGSAFGRKKRRSPDHPAADIERLQFLQSGRRKNRRGRVCAAGHHDAGFRNSIREDATSRRIHGNPREQRRGCATPASGGYGSGYYVQVAAVSRKEDADALVEALKKKQYPAFSANNPSSDKFYHVQVGPYADAKDAEGMRTRLIGDGYNPIVKK
jgi:hypothetical protein